MIKTFRDLMVWQKAHCLVLEIYKITSKFPKDYAHFINIAESSLEETKYHIILGKDLDYIKEVDYDRLNNMCDEIGKMLYSFYKKLMTDD